MRDGFARPAFQRARKSSILDITGFVPSHPLPYVPNLYVSASGWLHLIVTCGFSHGFPFCPRRSLGRVIYPAFYSWLV